MLPQVLQLKQKPHEGRFLDKAKEEQQEYVSVDHSKTLCGATAVHQHLRAPNACQATNSNQSSTVTSCLQQRTQ